MVRAAGNHVAVKISKSRAGHAVHEIALKPEKTTGERRYNIKRGGGRKGKEDGGASCSLH